MRPSYEIAKRERQEAFDRKRAGIDFRAWYREPLWHALRSTQLRSHPQCLFHQRMGVKVQATIVDHIKPHRGSRALFFDARNLQSLCESCHNRVKQSRERSRFKPVGKDGWPTDK
jgi:5-methylcytosine-specific restriction protein A